MNALKLLFIASAAFAISGCSFDKNDNSDSKVNAENYAYLKGKYVQVAGLYRGNVMLTNGSPAPAIEIALTTVDVASGTNSRGQTLLIPALVARVAFSADPDVVLNKVDYRDDTVPPELLMTSAAADASNPQNMTARFEVQGTDLVGTVSRSGRVVGSARLVLISRENSGPASGDQEAENERVRRALAPVVGTYYGSVTPPRTGGSKTEKFWINVDITISSKKDPRFPAENRQIPTLAGRVRRQNAGPGDLGTKVSISYLPEANPPIIYMVADGSVDGTNPEPISVSARFVGDVIEGTFQGYDGRNYPMKIERQ